MKRTLSVVLCAALLASLASCSEASSKKEADIDYTTLDSTWECDYLKIATNSNWHEYDSINGNLTLVDWSWGTEDNQHYADLSLSHNLEYTKLSQNEVTERWNNFKKFALDDDLLKDDYKDDFIEDTFVKNGQAYLIIDKGKNDKKEIQFYAHDLHGTFSYNNADTEIIMRMIDSINFY